MATSRHLLCLLCLQIIEESITSLILPDPRARTARAAAALLGQLIEQVGSGEGFGVQFSDMKEVW